MDNTGRQDRTLRGIATVLIAHAVLAKRVSRRSWPLRFLVLLILRPAESVAWAFVADLTGGLPPFLEYTPEGGNDPVDALELAMRFRALAAILDEMFRQECRVDCWRGSLVEAAGLPEIFTHALACAPVGRQPALIDTS